MPVNPVIGFKKPKKNYSEPEDDYSQLPRDYAQAEMNIGTPPAQFDAAGIDQLAALGLPELTEPESVYKTSMSASDKALEDAKHFEEVQAKYPEAQSTGGANYYIPAPADSGGWRNTLSPDEAWIIQRESGFNPSARNPSSGAFGLWQGLGSTLTGQAQKFGFDPYTTDPNQQLTMFRSYVSERYGSAAAAVEFWKKNGWY